MTNEHLTELENRSYGAIPGPCEDDVKALCQEIRRLNAKMKRLEVLHSVCRRVFKTITPAAWITEIKQRILIDFTVLEPIKVAIDMLDEKES